ncbi:hypothetical protein SAMN05421858_1781 [Haladaptatus litoreus]|uniref:Uncharacterized protein n=1 Tax=Haladaptatus litoreus TaxID=553468 RepID=A0A1N6YYE9_9EURY|nr:hypothetical protein [Haladaptatus litoreus]SIR19614.1 hypothetical protein SAMN05421858_1781 [Haladaptatus litoreus]
MSTTGSDVEIPSEAAAVARRYHRLERASSSAMAVLVASVVGLAILFFPLLIGLLVALVVIAMFRIPLFRSSGKIQLTSNAAPATVVAEFESATPPVLVLQWGIADSIHPTPDGATYDFSYLFGLRSVSMETKISSVTPVDNGSATELTLDITTNGQPWATYRITIHEPETETVVDVELIPERRFGLRRLPQWLVASYYRTDALSAQGYKVVERDESFSL